MKLIVKYFFLAGILFLEGHLKLVMHSAKYISMTLEVKINKCPFVMKIAV